MPVTGIATTKVHEDALLAFKNGVFPRALLSPSDLRGGPPAMLSTLPSRSLTVVFRPFRARSAVATLPLSSSTLTGSASRIASGVTPEFVADDHRRCLRCRHADRGSWGAFNTNHPDRARLRLRPCREDEHPITSAIPIGMGTTSRGASDRARVHRLDAHRGFE
jgi:hypothetical protein